MQGDDPAQQAQALETLKESLQIRKRLADAYLAIPNFQHDLAASPFNLARVQRRISQPAAALESTMRACGIWEKLRRDNPSVPGYEQNLVTAYNGLGVLLMETKPEEALDYLNKALHIREEHLRVNPKNVQFRMELAFMYNNIGSLEHNRGRSAAALPFFEKARDFQEKLAQEQPDVSSFHEALAGTYENICRALTQLHCPWEALAARGSAMKHHFLAARAMDTPTGQRGQGAPKPAPPVHSPPRRADLP